MTASTVKALDARQVTIWQCQPLVGASPQKKIWHSLQEKLKFTWSSAAVQSVYYLYSFIFLMLLAAPFYRIIIMIDEVVMSLWLYVAMDSIPVELEYSWLVIRLNHIFRTPKAESLPN